MKKYISTLIAIYIVFYGSLFVSPAYTQENKIRVVYTEWFPYTYEHLGQASGFEIEILKAVMETLDREIELIKFPWKRCLISLKKGQADALVSMLKSPERETYTYYADEYISLSRVVFFKKKERNITYTGDLHELKPYSVGVILGFTYGEAFEKAAYIKKDYTIRTDLLIKKVLHGRNDLGVENQIVTMATTHKMGINAKFHYFEPPLFSKKLYVGFSKAKGHKKLSREFSTALEKFKKTDDYRNIINNYGLTREFLSEQ